MHTTVDAHVWADNPPRMTVEESGIGNGTVVLVVSGSDRGHPTVESGAVHLYFHGSRDSARDLVEQLRDAINAFLNGD